MCMCVASRDLRLPPNNCRVEYIRETKTLGWLCGTGMMLGGSAP